MKKIFTFMAAALFAVGASAQIDNPVDVKATWALTDGTTASVVSPASAGEATLTTGAGLEILADAKPFNGINFMAFQATSEDKGDNKYDKAVELEKYVDFTITPSDLFSLSKVSFDIVKVGTGDPKIYIDIIDGDGQTSHIGTDIDIRRNNDDEDLSINQTYEVTTSASDKAVTLRIYVGKLANNKQVGIANVVIEGTIKGDNITPDDPSTGGDDQGNTGGDEPIEGAYIAWVYTAGYGAQGYAFETDPLVIALQKEYNVVAMDIAETTNPTTDEELNGKLLGAQVVVVCEAMTGNKTMSNSLVNYVGKVPVVALKAYNYNDGRWSWGTPANPNPKALGFTPKNNTYKVLDGVTYEEDGTVKVATSDATNVIQTVTFGAGAPEDMVIMGTVGGEDTDAAMYASKAQKFFGLGLSSDCWSTYTANAGIIVKNAVAMLIAGEDLTAVDTETGIQNVVKTVNNGAIYNLAGQKVDENYKGVVIKNGKKVVLK